MPADNRFVYRPPFWARGPVAQSTLARSKIRRRGPNPMLEQARKEIITTSEGVRLQGFFSPSLDGRDRGLVILLPGWESSAHSTYVVCTGRTLYRAGYSVYRLNFRDHGGTHHLNEGLFHAALLQEVVEAVQQAAGKADGGPVALIGFSMGGNYVLRLARWDIPRLRLVVAVSPVLDPLASTRLMDAHPLFRSYFRERWLQSLKRKEALFPLRYDFSELYAEPSILAMTDLLLKRYTDFPSLEAYFEQYNLTPERLAGLRAPTHLIASEDDPVVDNRPYDAYQGVKNLHLHVQSRGGHVGFVGPFLRTAWYEKVIRRLLEELDSESDQRPGN